MTSPTKRRARVIAFYLPQFHPIPENDEWWGKGFTEWTVVTKARPLFRGHEQPKLPGELGFYDLRVPEVREAQAALAREHGIEGFCYWHYWLGNGRRLLERPFEEVLRSGKPDFPFCLGWANHSWVGRFFGAKGRMLVEQVYSGIDDHTRHFEWLLGAFSDERYIRVDGKPLFYIFNPDQIPEIERVLDHWRRMAERAGLGGLHIVGRGLTSDKTRMLGMDGYSYCMSATLTRLKQLAMARRFFRWLRKIRCYPNVFPYEVVIRNWLPRGPADINGYPDVLPNWDNTPRLGSAGEVYEGCTPDHFRVHLADVLSKVEHKPMDRRLVFLKSWNEWAEGNYLEPDAEYGRARLEVVRDENMTSIIAPSVLSDGCDHEC